MLIVYLYNCTSPSAVHIIISVQYIETVCVHKSKTFIQFKVVALFAFLCHCFCRPVCSAAEFVCPEKCILSSFLCDGINHCDNGEDEDPALCTPGESGAASAHDDRSRVEVLVCRCHW